MPVALGAILIVCATVIALSGGGAANPASGSSGLEHESGGTFDVRGGLAITVGVVIFMVLGDYAGLVPASFCSVLIAALGDRRATLKSSVILASGVAIFGSLLFVYGLKVPFPLIRW